MTDKNRLLLQQIVETANEEGIFDGSGRSDHLHDLVILDEPVDNIVAVGTSDGSQDSWYFTGDWEVFESPAKKPILSPHGMIAEKGGTRYTPDDMEKYLEDDSGPQPMKVAEIIQEHDRITRRDEYIAPPIKDVVLLDEPYPIPPNEESEADTLIAVAGGYDYLARHYICSDGSVYGPEDISWGMHGKPSLYAYIAEHGEPIGKLELEEYLEDGTLD